ncbi:MAG TPA: xylose isomerase, partial [Acidobacteriota bacterium]
MKNNNAQIKIGTAPISWGIMEVSGWGRLKAFSEVLDEMVGAGYEGTELGPYGYFPTDPLRLTAELSSRGLQLVSAFVPVALAKPDRHEASYQQAIKTAELIAGSGARSIILADEMNSDRMAVAGRVVAECNGMTERQWEGAAKILTRIARACQTLGLDATFHHHAGTFVETPLEIERLCSATEP